MKDGKLTVTLVLLGGDTIRVVFDSEEAVDDFFVDLEDATRKGGMVSCGGNATYALMGLQTINTKLLVGIQSE